MENLTFLYKYLRTGKKERFNMILEPFQATMQLSMLAFMPIGTKLVIYNNILYLHEPKWHQGLVRMYNNDNKEDIYLLFHVLVRFSKFYEFLKLKPDTQKLYSMMVELSKKGIDNLILTYQQSNDYALLNILHMYRTIMDNPDDYANSDRIEMKEIDKIFVNIKDLYVEEDYCIAQSVLSLLQKTTDQQCLICGYEKIQQGRHLEIHKWICDNLIY